MTLTPLMGDLLTELQSFCSAPCEPEMNKLAGELPPKTLPSCQNNSCNQQYNPKQSESEEGVFEDMV